jgi:hypothetical protein
MALGAWELERELRFLGPRFCSCGEEGTRNVSCFRGSPGKITAYDEVERTSL